MVYADPFFDKAFYMWFHKSLKARQERIDEADDDDDDDNLKPEEDSTAMTPDDRSVFRSLQVLGWVQSQGALLEAPLGDALRKTIMMRVKSVVSRSSKSTKL